MTVVAGARGRFMLGDRSVSLCTDREQAHVQQHSQGLNTMDS